MLPVMLSVVKHFPTIVASWWPARLPYLRKFTAPTSARHRWNSSQAAPMACSEGEGSFGHQWHGYLGDRPDRTPEAVCYGGGRGECGLPNAHQVPFISLVNGSWGARWCGSSSKTSWNPGTSQGTGPITERYRLSRADESDLRELRVKLGGPGASAHVADGVEKSARTAIGGLPKPVDSRRNAT